MTVKEIDMNETERITDDTWREAADAIGPTLTYWVMQQAAAKMTTTEYATTAVPEIGMMDLIGWQGRQAGLPGHGQPQEATP